MDVSYTEASMHIRSSEAHADAEHTRRLAFVQQGMHVLVSQLNTEMTAKSFRQGYFAARGAKASSTEAHFSKHVAHNSRPSLRDSVRLKHNELQTAQLRKSFDDNRSSLLEYLRISFGGKRLSVFRC